MSNNSSVSILAKHIGGNPPAVGTGDGRGGGSGGGLVLVELIMGGGLFLLAKLTWTEKRE